MIILYISNFKTAVKTIYFEEPYKDVLGLALIETIKVRKNN